MVYRVDMNYTSFVIGLYNAAGPGQEVDAQIMERIHAIKKPLHIKILVTLACSMCPDLVIAAQKIAAENPQVTAEIYDVIYIHLIRNAIRL